MAIASISTAVYAAPAAAPAPAPAPAAAPVTTEAPAAARPAAPVSFPSPTEVSRVSAGQGEAAQLQATFEQRPSNVQGRVDELKAQQAQRDRTDAIYEKVEALEKKLSVEDQKAINDQARTALDQWKQNHGYATPTVEGEMAFILKARKLNEFTIGRSVLAPEGSDLKQLQQATQDYMDGRIPLVQAEERAPGTFQAMDQRRESSGLYGTLWNTQNMSRSLLGQAFETGLFTGGEYNQTVEDSKGRVQGFLQAAGGPVDAANRAELPALAFVDALADRSMAKLGGNLNADQALVAETLVDTSQRYMDLRTSYLAFINRP